MTRTGLIMRIMLIFGLAGGYCFSDSGVEKLGLTMSSYKIFDRANALYREGKYAKAIILYKKAETRGIDPSSAAFNIGNCHFRLNNIPEAAAAFKKAGRLSEGKNLSAFINLAGTLFRMEQYGECIAVYRRVLAADPENLSAWLYLSEAYSRTGDMTGAQQALEEANYIDPDDISILYQLAEIHVQLKEYEPAIKLIRDAYSRKPREVDFLFYIGDLYRTQNDFSKAASAFREGLSQKPNDFNVLYKLADVLYQDKKPFLAMEYLQQALTIKTDYTDAAVFLGNLAYDQKWWERSEKAYLQALEYGNNEGLEGMRNLAIEYLESGQADYAVEILTRASKFAPDNESLKLEIKQYRELAENKQF